METIDTILERMIGRHEEMSKAYFINSFTFKKETKEEYIKNRTEEVRFKIKSDTLDNIITIKQSCWLDEKNNKIYFKTKYYIDDKLTRKNINFLKEIYEDICLDPDVEIEHPVKPQEPKKPENTQMNLFDLL